MKVVKAMGPSCSRRNARQLNAFTVDVEDYFQVAAFRKWVRFEDWPGYPTRVERNTDRIFEILDSFQVKATFFVLGWIAEHYPRMVQDIQAQGHELACHGYGHQSVHRLSQRMFREDIRKAKHILEDIAGKEILGYRAPNYSINGDSLWATDILLEEGFQYDSSVFPVKYFRNGLPKANRFPHLLHCPSGRVILEFPPSTIHMLGLTIPIAGGAYLRHFPFVAIKESIRRINQRNKPAIIYIHPWEIDPEQPRIDGIDPLTRMRHYGQLETTEKKLIELLRSFYFGTIRQLRGILEQR